jgi:TetR/AcrR family transcriptional regulator, transcriptional repressor for nem operon
MKNTKQHILKSAVELFLQKTYKEVTMKEIVEKTGLSKGAFYHYFQSKEQLFKEVLDTFLTSSMEVKWDTYPQNSLKDFINRILAFSHEVLLKMQMGMDQAFDLNYFSLYFDGLKLFPDFQTTLSKHQQDELNAWIKTVGNARKSGEIKSSMTDEQIARIFTHVSDGSLLTLLLQRSKNPVAIDYIKVLWEGLYNQIRT